MRDPIYEKPCVFYLEVFYWIQACVKRFLQKSDFILASKSFEQGREAGKVLRCEPVRLGVLHALGTKPIECGYVIC